MDNQNIKEEFENIPENTNDKVEQLDNIVNNCEQQPTIKKKSDWKNKIKDFIKKSEMKSFITKTEGLLIFAVVILVFILGFTTISSNITSSSEDVNAQMQIMANKINKLEYQIEDLQDSLDDANAMLKAERAPFLGVGFCANNDIHNADTGIYVCVVYDGSPAQKVGMRSGDLLVEVNGTKINTWEDLDAIMAPLSAGDQITIRYLTAMEDRLVTITADVTLDYRKNFVLG